MERTENDSEEIYLIEYLNIIRKRKFLIIIIILSSLAVTAVKLYFSPKIYQATAVLIPASQPSQQTGMSALAAQLGMSATPGVNVSELVRLLKSNILMERAINKHDLFSVLFKKKDLDAMRPENKTWNAIRRLRSVFAVKYEQREGIIELSAESEDPAAAAGIIKHMLSELIDYMSSEAKRVAETNRRYLESLIVKNSDPLIRQKIYSLIAQQIETSMMAEVKENFAFKVIDPPMAPDRKIRPRIAKAMMSSFSISLVAGIFTAFFIEYIQNLKRRHAQGKK